MQAEIELLAVLQFWVRDGLRGQVRGARVPVTIPAPVAGKIEGAQRQTPRPCRIAYSANIAAFFRGGRRFRRLHFGEHGRTDLA